MDIEKLKEAASNLEFIASVNPNWSHGRNSGLDDDATEILADQVFNVVNRDIHELIDFYVSRQSVKSEEVAEAIEYFEDTLQFIVGEPQEKDHRLAITALQAYQPWIPVSNIKPEKSGRYIAYVPEHWTADSHKEGKVIIAYFRELNYEGKRRAWDDGAWGISGEVTHYMPLPEPPKGE